MRTNDRRFLLSGIPGCGKTTLGNYLAAEHGFRHIDMEADNHAFAMAVGKDPQLLRDLLNSEEGDTVVSWGFSPIEHFHAAQQLTQDTLPLVWLDGDRPAALRSFLARETGDPFKEWKFYAQVGAVILARVVETIPPTLVLNPFDERGEFRPLADIATQLLGEFSP